MVLNEEKRKQGNMKEKLTESLHLTVKIARRSNRPFPSSPGSLYQIEVKCSAFDMEMIFHSHANKTPFHKKGCVIGLILKVRVYATRKWPITTLVSETSHKQNHYRNHKAAQSEKPTNSPQ